MNVLVLGLNHQIQFCRQHILTLDEVLLAFEVEQKENYARTLIRQIHKRGVQFVGEEALPGVESIAHRTAGRLNVRYANIDMPPHERGVRQIPLDYAEKNSPYLAEQRAAWHHEREQYMSECAIAEARDADNILVVCGREHTEALTELFRAGDHGVDTYDLLQEAWYVEDWDSRILGSA